jgi:glycosyltransferase involved in cell wall biosynthesis
MKIAMVLDTDFPPDVRVENEAKSFIEAGAEVHLFSLSYKPFSESYEVINGIFVHRYKANKFVFKLSAIAMEYPFYRWLISKSLKRYFNKVKPDLVYVHDMLIAEAVLDVLEGTSIPKVLDLHENRPAIMAHYPHVRSGLGRFVIDLNTWHRKQIKFIQKYDHIVVVTDQARDHYVGTIGVDPSNFSVVPNSVHQDVYEGYEQNLEIVNRYKEDFVILYIGNTGLRRGTLFAIEAMQSIVLEIPSAKLVLVGDSSEDHILKKKVFDLGLQKYVDFQGWKPMNLFSSYINAASVCISPLERNLHHDTTFANKIFQYISGERPIVVSACPPQAQVAIEGECGKVFEAGNKPQYVKAIVELNNSPENRREMGENGRRYLLAKYDFHKAVLILKNKMEVKLFQKHT